MPLMEIILKNTKKENFNSGVEKHKELKIVLVYDIYNKFCDLNIK